MASLQFVAPDPAGTLFASADLPGKSDISVGYQPSTEHLDALLAATAISDRPTWDLPAEHLPIEQSFRHSWWSNRRRRTYDALNAAGVSPRRLINFQHCGEFASVLVEQKTGAIKVSSCKCHDRFCQACGEERGRELSDALQALCCLGKTLHVVLTLMSTDAPLDECLDRIYKCFGKLRTDKWWKLHATGGSASFECTYNAVTKQWHPHLHVLVQADYLDQRKLRETWLRITGDSHVCNVSLVGQGRAAAREVTKYISKPIHRSVDGDQALIVELIGSLKGRRLITTFGTWRGGQLTCYCKELDTSKWYAVCSLVELHNRAAAGDLWSCQALRYLNSRRPGRVHVDLPTAMYPPPPLPVEHPPAG